MHTQADKKEENKSQTVANAIAHKQSGSESTFQFVDNRPEAIAQRKLQEMANNSPQDQKAAQLQSIANNRSAQSIQKQGLEEEELLQGEFESDKPAQLQAHFYAQGTDIHLGLGQEKHLPHQAWHMIQQKQSNIQPTMQINDGVNVNDNIGLEKETQVMRSKSLISITDSHSIQEKSIFGETVAQRIPTQNAHHQWLDAAINATTYPNFYALAQAHIATYRAYNGANLKNILALFRKHLTPDQLRTLIDDNFETNIQNEICTLNIRTIRMPGVTQAQVDAMVLGAHNILNNFNIQVNVASTVVVTPAQLAGGITGVDGQGRYASGTTGQDQWTLIGNYMNGNELPVLFVPDVTGYGFWGKPNGITLELNYLGASRSMVLMRTGQSGQTLAHEIGHAMGGILGAIQHGQHVNSFDEWNLMHGDPILGGSHTDLRIEQVAAFKGSRFVT